MFLRLEWMNRPYKVSSEMIKSSCGETGIRKKFKISRSLDLGGSNPLRSIEWICVSFLHFSEKCDAVGSIVGVGFVIGWNL